MNYDTSFTACSKPDFSALKKRQLGEMEKKDVADKSSVAVEPIATQVDSIHTGTMNQSSSSSVSELQLQKRITL